MRACLCVCVFVCIFYIVDAALTAAPRENRLGNSPMTARVAQGSLENFDDGFFWYRKVSLVNFEDRTSCEYLGGLLGGPRSIVELLKALVGQRGPS